ncbi:MAG: HEPN domain-containing protein [Armatimonadetes bacterium]|nr:HEPN domain-containing protein [Armatimonadota bacterium]
MEGKEQALGRAMDFLESAEVCYSNGKLAGCALCCYAAMFWAAVAALMHVGVRKEKWAHGDLQQQFGLHLIRKYHMLPSQLGRWFQDAYDLRNKAHYRLADLNRKAVEKIFFHAQEFVKLVSEVILS